MIWAMRILSSNIVLIKISHTKTEIKRRGLPQAVVPARNIIPQLACGCQYFFAKFFIYFFHPNT